ncbi:MAG: GrpB family protein [Dehalococcoidia bacterium]
MPLVEHPSLEHRELARRRGVVLVPYDPDWPSRFAEAAAAIVAACAGVVTAIEHVGSTSIPGLGAKPFIDIMPGLSRHSDGPAMVAPMASLGYEYRGEFGISGRHYFTRHIEGDSSVWKHNVHTYEVGHVEWDRHLVFRDALRADAALAQRYLDLKLDLAGRFPEDVDAYAMAKSEFVEAVIAEHGGPARPPEQT